APRRGLPPPVPARRLQPLRGRLPSMPLFSQHPLGAVEPARRGAIVALVRHPRPIVALCALALCAAPVARALAASAPPPPSTGSPALWATIDVCNPPAEPDTIGIRGSMPGT